VRIFFILSTCKDCPCSALPTECVCAFGSCKVLSWWKCHCLLLRPCIRSVQRVILHGVCVRVCVCVCVRERDACTGVLLPACATACVLSHCMLTVQCAVSRTFPRLRVQHCAQVHGVLLMCHCMCAESLRRCSVLCCALSPSARKCMCTRPLQYQ
jgi:hypothetical protein